MSRLQATDLTNMEGIISSFYDLMGDVYEAENTEDLTHLREAYKNLIVGAHEVETMHKSWFTQYKIGETLRILKDEVGIDIKPAVEKLKIDEIDWKHDELEGLRQFGRSCIALMNDYYENNNMANFPKICRLHEIIASTGFYAIIKRWIGARADGLNSHT